MSATEEAAVLTARKTYSPRTAFRPTMLSRLNGTTHVTKSGTPNPKPAHDGVSRTEHVGPTHAAGLEQLVGINGNIRQGDPFNDMRLDFDLSCGIAPLSIQNVDYDLGLRSCFVALERQNCEIQVGSRYEYWLEIGDFKSREKKRVLEGQSRQGSMALGGDLNPLTGIANLAAKFGLSRARTRSSTAEKVTEQSWRIELITTSGQDRWRVGDLTRGDARRPDGILSGDYFLEKKTSENESYPLCKLNRIDASEPVVATITVTASFGSLLVFPAGQNPDTANVMPPEGRGLLRRRANRAAAKHSELLAAHIAGLVLAKKIRNAQQRETNKPLGNEFVVAKQTLIAYGLLNEERGNE